MSNRSSKSHSTINDVARLAAVSPATVSRVLNKDPRVGDDYRARVAVAVDRLGYRPNRLARNLRKRRSGALALVVPDITNAHFAEMVRTIEAEAYRAGHHVLVCGTDEDPEKESTYLDMLLDERVLGVIVSPSDPHGTQIARLIDHGIPVVAFDREVYDPRADAVIADNVGATRAATTLLIEAGHRDVALISGRIDVETGAERLTGYEHAMLEAGLEPNWMDGGFRVQGGYQALAALARSARPPTAVVVANNLMTMGALAASRDHGLRVPSDIAIVGIDDPIWAALVDPPLTVVAQPVHAMALDAMVMLMDRIAAVDAPPRRRVHAFELIVRESCGTGSTPATAPKR